LKGKYDGLVTTYHSYGNDSSYKLYSKNYLSNGQYIGPDSVFDENGNVWKIYQFSGKETFFTSFHDNGKISSRGLMKYPEKRIGEWISFHENGQIESVVNFTNDKENGDASYFYSNGRLKSTGQFSKGNKNGKWIECDSSGINISYGNYKPVAITRSEDDSIPLLPDTVDYQIYSYGKMMWVDFGVKTGIWITYNNVDKTLYRQRYFKGRIVK
jgi:antitoxin component YwqK of YwqJK toxin-antitoxin module